MATKKTQDKKQGTDNISAPVSNGMARDMKKLAKTKASHSDARLTPKASSKKAKVADTSIKMEAPVFSVSGDKKGIVSLPESLFGQKWNADLVHQVVTSMRGNARNTVAHTKDRGEVRGGGRKPWKQKGTGRARHGSSRSPIWVGGGITHGPRKTKVFERKINKGMRVKALAVVLSRKMRDGEVLFLDTLSFKEPKAREAKSILTKLSGIKEFGALSRRNNAALIALPSRNSAVEKSFRNFGNVAVEEARNLNPVSVLGKRLLLIVSPDKSLASLSARIK